jgi:transketolase
VTDHKETPQVIWKSIAALSADGVEKAKSGHPGTAMGAAEAMAVLWGQVLDFDPQDPDWINRDRFILSAGHASMLLYSLLHLFGYEDMTIDELKNFRQWHSRTAGHPEFGEAAGIETTTGPLGQGIANAVGMAWAHSMLAARFNTVDFSPITSKVWALCGDGCLMEGISYEACSLAGHLGLGSLTLIYDRNKITIEGSTDIAFTEDVRKRFEAMNWLVLEVSGFDQNQLLEAFKTCREERERPSLIIMTTDIGRLAGKKQGTSKVHGEPLGEETLAEFKKNIGWPPEMFYVPAEARDWCALKVAEKQKNRQTWLKGFETWKKNNPELAKLWDQYFNKNIGAELSKAMLQKTDLKAVAATRKHSGNALNLAAALVPNLIGGSADLNVSNNSDIAGGGDVGIRNSADEIAASFKGRILHFGVREHSMGAILNGMALHGAFRAFGATFLQFADYMRPAIRLAALMKAKSIFVFTHDSIFLGEDGPTHQAVEHISALRLIPNLEVWRPAEALETVQAWAWALSRAQGPVCILGSRQNLPALPFSADFDPEQVWKGAYVLIEDAQADCTLIGTGSEVSLCLEARELLAKQGIKTRIVSMPCMDLFLNQPSAEQEKILGSKPRVAVEAGVSPLWRSLVRDSGLIIGLDRFGASAPAKILAEKFGFTGQAIFEKISDWLKK